MSNSYHKLKGRLCYDPDLKPTKNGKPQARINLAVSTGNKDNEVTEFWTIWVYGAFATGQAKHLTKGDMVIVEGESCKAGVYREKGQLNLTSFDIMHINYHKKDNNNTQVQDNNSDADLPF